MAFSCCYCEKSYSSPSNLSRHIKEVHNATNEENSVLNYFKCLEGCNVNFAFNADLRDHLKNIHGHTMEKECFKFKALEEFHTWLNDVQKSSNSAYIKPTGAVKNENSTQIITYFNCNRSGKGRILQGTSRKCMLKSEGSRKIGTACTSQIIMIEGSEHIQVIFHKNHYGHTFEVHHLPLTQEERSTLASHLTQGITMSKILDKYRENVLENPERVNLVTRKDLHNIKASYNISIQDGVRHKEDAISVDMWIQECQEMDQNPILFYKPQGLEHSELKKQDFCLVMMNKSQEYMLKRFSNKVICIDSTHGINNYDFELTTLMVIDDYGEGFPGACLITNRKDSKVFELFFKCIKSKLGILVTKTFMSDITNVFYNSWVKVMGPVGIQLFCAWHIDRAWQKQLSKISNIEKRQQVYQALKVLQQTLDTDEFHNMLANTMELLVEDQQTKSFGIYFQQHYAYTFKQWAYCYRKNAGVNTNMHLESMHKIVKYLYLNAKKKQRLDKGLNALNKYIRDKIVDQTIKSMKGKNTVHIQQINKRHQSALSSDFNTECHSDKENTWFVMSNSNPSNYYIVSKNIQPTSCCKLICTLCNICFHFYSCTCTDFSIKITICKHIHFISLKFGHESKSQIFHPPSVHFISNLSEPEKPLATIKSSIKEKTERELGLLSSKISSINDPEILSYIHIVLKNANSFVTTSQKKNVLEPFPEVEIREPPNKKINKPLTFFSTKKTSKKSKSSLTKPGVSDSSNIRKMLLNKEELISRNSLEDHNYF